MGKKKINPLILKCRIEFSFLGYQIVSNHFDFVVSSRFHRNDNFVVILCYRLSSRKNPKDRLEFDLGSRIFFSFFSWYFQSFHSLHPYNVKQNGTMWKKKRKKLPSDRKRQTIEEKLLEKNILFFSFILFKRLNWLFDLEFPFLGWL